MAKVYETCGAMTLDDVYGIVLAMSQQYTYQKETNKSFKAKGLLSYLSTISNVYVNALPIEVIKTSVMLPNLEFLKQVIADYYELQDQQLQKIKGNMYTARYITECIEKAEKTYDKVQIHKTSSIMEKS